MSGHLGNLFSSSSGTVGLNDVPKSLKSVTVKGGKKIPAYSFLGCSNIETINLPDTITSIGPEAFNGCSSLKNFVIPDSVAAVSSKVFYNCSNLTEITIPDSVTSLNITVFEGSSFKIIRLGSGIKSIPTIVKATEELYIKDSITNITSSIFNNATNLHLLNYSGTVEQFKNISFSNMWNSSFPDDFVIVCSNGTVELDVNGQPI